MSISNFKSNGSGKNLSGALNILLKIRKFIQKVKLIAKSKTYKLLTPKNLTIIDDVTFTKVSNCF